MHDPFHPDLHGGVQFAHDHPVTGLGDHFQKINWQARTDDPHRASLGCFTCGGGRPYVAATAPQGPFVLPQPPDQPRLNIEIHTLRWGNPPWMAECAPTLDDWCARHDLPLMVRSTWSKEWPTDKYCIIEMMRDFLAGKSDWMMFLDADIVMHPMAPRPFFEESGFHVRFDFPFKTMPKWQKHWRDWVRDHCDEELSSEWIYRNTGVWACDRESARKFLDEVAPPYHIGFLEQHQMNWWLIQAGKKSGLRTLDLDVCWNHTPDDMSPGWAFHIYGKKKLPSLFNFRAAGLLPDPVKPLDGLPPLIDIAAGDRRIIDSRIIESRIIDSRIIEEKFLKNDSAVHDSAKNLPTGAVVWPYKAGAAQWDELWFSHRSVLQHWSEKDWPLVLLGDECPPWWPGKFIHAPSYEHALWLGTQCADRVLWMNDDIFLLADQGPEDLARAAVLEDMRPKLGETMVAANSWRRGLGQVLMRLHHHGKSTLNFSTHTPYLYDRAKVREIFDRFGIFYKLPFETAYHNWHATPSQPATAKSKGPHDLAGKLWINPSFGQATREFRAELAARFDPPP